MPIADDDVFYEFNSPMAQEASTRRRGGVKRRQSMSLIVASMLAATGLFVAPMNARSADDSQQTLKSKQLTLVVAFNPGGTYDLSARIFASHYGRHLAGTPSIVVRNMQGANGARGATYLATQAPRDGSAIGMLSQAIASKKVLDDPSLKMDVRDFNWVGRIASTIEATVVWHTSPTKTMQDAMARETILAATGALGTPEVNPKLMNRYADTKFRVITGYPGGAATMLAMEKGEVEGAYSGLGTLLSQHQDWLREKKIAVLVQYSSRRHPAFSGVPAMVEFAKTPQDKAILELFASSAEIGVSIVAPPALESASIAALRQAFTKTVGDPLFTSDALAKHIDVDPLTGEELQALIARVLDTPPDVAKKAAEALQ